MSISGAEPLSRTGLLAAARWIDELGKRNLTAAGLVLRGAPEYRGLTPTQYQVGFEWLVAVGIVSRDGELLLPVVDPGSLVLEVHLLLDPPAWFSEAADFVRSEGELPIDLAEAASELGLRDGEAFAAMQRAWVKFDDTRRREVGAAGEVALSDWLQGRYSGRIMHISQLDDSAGFDLLVGTGLEAHVEIKATLKVGDFTLYLSRNEFRVMRQDPSWCLQVVRLTRGDETTLSSLGWIPNEKLEHWAPRDSGPGRWESFSVRVREDELRPGLSPRLQAAIE